MVPDNDNDLIEVKEIAVPEGLDLFDIGPLNAAPAADATGTETVQPGAEQVASPSEAAPSPPPLAAPSIPPWLSDIPESERAQVLASGLSSLPVEQLLQLEPVRDLLGQAQTLAAAQASQASQQQNEQAQRQQALMQEAQLFEQELGQYVPQDYNLRQRTDNYTLAVQQDYHQFLAGRVQKGILDGFARLGLGPQNLPPALVARVNQARDYDGVIQAYVDAAADRGFELGRLKERNDTGTRSKADETALRARIRNEVLGQLSRDGKIALSQEDQGYFAQLQAESTPPSLSGTPVPVSGELDDAEVLAALADPDAYERLMNDPVKAKAFNKAMAGELARQ